MEDDVGRRVVLTAPSSINGDAEDEYKAPSLLQRILSLLKNARPGSNLAQFQVPPTFNIPKSQLQYFGESTYCIHDELLSRCNNGGSSLDRFISVVVLCIFTCRTPKFGVAPYNPILGETHHVSRGSLSVLLEQVSHHPPVSALHATDEKHNIEMTYTHYPVAKFYGTSVEAILHGKRQIKLLNRGETYVMNFPKLAVRFLPLPSMDWAGKVRIRCQESGLEAELCYKGNSFLSLGANHRSVKGKIFKSSSLGTICEISGHWNKVITVKDFPSGKIMAAHSAEEAVSVLKTPVVKDPKRVLPTESAVVWAEVSKCILDENWDKARAAKTIIEERERELVRERKSKGLTWVPKHFTVSNSNGTNWECSPIQNRVSPAPIIIPF